MLPVATALVTGGSRGIGRGVCLELARRGYAVAVNYHRRRDAAEDTADEIIRRIGRPALICRGDVAVTGDRDRIVDQVMTAWGRIDVLVNNAGITSLGRRDALDATEDSWERVFAVNLRGPFFLTQRVAREMIRLAPSGALHHPCIVNISSMSAFAVSTNRADYCIAKAGMSMMTRIWAVRLAEHGIRVYEVRPGLIATDMTAPVREHYNRRIAEGISPIRRWGTSEDVGRSVAALASGDFPFSTGDAVHVDGGFHISRL